MAIEKITLRNFQCYRKTVVELDPKLTVIVGPSDRGKSAMLRGLEWVATNRPSGDAFIREGSDQCSAEVVAEGRSVKRTKGKGVNSYELDGLELKAFGTDVPDGVKQLMNVDPGLNLVGQFDPPFWLSKSAGEVSRELNRVVNLQLIDDTMASLASSLKKTRSTADVVRDRLASAERDLESMSWVDAAADAVRSAQAVSDALGEAASAVGRADAALSKLSELESTPLAPVPDFGSADKFVGAIEKAASDAARMTALLDRVSKLEDEGCQIDRDAASVSDALGAIKQCPLCSQPLPRPS